MKHIEFYGNSTRYCDVHLDAVNEAIRTGKLRDIEQIAHYVEFSVYAYVQDDYYAVDLYLFLLERQAVNPEAPFTTGELGNLAYIAVSNNRANAARARVLLTRIFEQFDQARGVA